MKTITIQIGNSDDKLSQKQWHGYVQSIGAVLYDVETHFSGGSNSWALWQNFAWVVICDEEQARQLKEKIIRIRKDYGQDSVAWTEGETEFV